jgi:hypothetical protein
MKKTLYLLRKPADRLHAGLFHPSESKGDVVLLEDAAHARFSYTGGTIWSLGTTDGDRILSYDTLLKKIFESDHTVVI